MKKFAHSAGRKSSRVRGSYAAALETLEPRMLLTAAIINRVDLTGYNAPIEANVDGQAGFELVAIKDNLVTVINQSKNTVQTFTFPTGSIIHVADPQVLDDTHLADGNDNFTFLQNLTNSRQAEIYATNGNFLYTLNVNTGIIKTANIGKPYASIVTVNLDGQAGLEYVLYTVGSSDYTVVNNHANTVALVKVDPYTSINFGNLDGKTGMDIYTVSGGNEVQIINPNTLIGHNFFLPSLVNLEPATIPMPNFNTVHSQDIVSVSTPGTYTLANQFGSQTVNLISGNAPLFAPVKLDNQSGGELVAMLGNSVWVINDRLNSLTRFNFPQNDVLHLSFAPDIFDVDNLTVGGTQALLFSSDISSITTLNIPNATLKTLKVAPGALLLTSDLGGGFGSQIITATANSVTILNPGKNTFKTYNITGSLNLGLDNLDGVTGDEIYLTSNSAITILYPLRQSFRTFTIGHFDNVITADLDGQPGDELYTTFNAGTGSSITVLNGRTGTFKTYNIGTYIVAVDRELDGQAGREIIATQPGGLTIINPRQQRFKTFAFDTSHVIDVTTVPVASLPGKQIVITTTTGVIIINAVTGTIKTFATGPSDLATPIFLGSPNNFELLSMTGTLFTFRNLVTGTVFNLNVDVPTSLANLFNANQMFFDDLDGKPGDEIFFFNGTVLTIVKAQ